MYHVVVVMVVVVVVVVVVIMTPTNLRLLRWASKRPVYTCTQLGGICQVRKL